MWHRRSVLWGQVALTFHKIDKNIGITRDLAQNARSNENPDAYGGAHPHIVVDGQRHERVGNPCFEVASTLAIIRACSVGPGFMCSSFGPSIRSSEWSWLYGHPHALNHQPTIGTLVDSYHLVSHSSRPGRPNSRNENRGHRNVQHGDASNFV